MLLIITSYDLRRIFANAIVTCSPLSAAVEAGGRQDFPRQSQELIIDPSPTLSDDFIVSIPINNDDINEAQEAFLIRLEVSDDTLNMAEAPSILLRNEGLTIGIIVDEDSGWLRE